MLQERTVGVVQVSPYWLFRVPMLQRKELHDDIVERWPGRHVVRHRGWSVVRTAEASQHEDTARVDQKRVFQVKADVAEGISL